MAKKKHDPLKIEEHVRNQVKSFLEVSNTSPDQMCKDLKKIDDSVTLSPLTVYNFNSGKSSIKLSNLELIINYMRSKGYIFEI